MLDQITNLIPSVPEQPWESNLASLVGHISSFRFAVSFFVSVLLGYGLRLTSSPSLRHLYSLITGLLLIYYPFGGGIIHIIISSTLVYLYMKYLPHNAGTLAWLTAFPYLIACHVVQSSGTAWKAGYIDFTGAQMVVTLKLVAAGMCVQDGYRRKQRIPPAAVAPSSSLSPSTWQLSTYASAKALDTPPSLLEWYSYVFAFGNLLAGPFFELKDYLDFINLTGDWDVPSLPGQKLPSPLIPGLLRFFKGIICAASWMYLIQTYNADLLESDMWYNQYSMWRRVPLIIVVGFVCRLKYYFAWSVAESSLIFSGLCFDGYELDDGEERDGDDKKGATTNIASSITTTRKMKPKWTRYINARSRKVEFSTSLAALAAHWNICTGKWLRHYVYERLSPPGKKPTFINMIVTQTVSGIWHGLFPGYWLFFVTSAFMFDASKHIYRYERTWRPAVQNFLPWVVFKMFFTAFILNYAAAAFVVLTWEYSFEAWRSVYFVGHILIFGIQLLAVVYPPSLNGSGGKVRDKKE